MEKYVKPKMEVIDIKNEVITASGIINVVCTSETCVGGDCADFSIGGSGNPWNAW